MDSINLVYQGNDAYSEALFLSLYSIVSHTPDAEFHVFFLTGDFSKIKPGYTPLKEETLKRMLDRMPVYAKRLDYRIINLDGHYDLLFKDNVNRKTCYSPYSMLRLLLDEIEEIPDKALYVDGDILALKDIKSLWNYDLKDMELGMVQDAVGHHYFGRRYCNSGILLMNMKEIRKSGIFKDIRKYLKRHRLFMPDQTSINRVCKKRVLLPRIYNEQSKTQEDTVLRHYCKVLHWFPFVHTTNIKPWNIDEFRRRFKDEAKDTIDAYEEILISEGKRKKN